MFCTECHTPIFADDAAVLHHEEGDEVLCPDCAAEVVGYSDTRIKPVYCHRPIEGYDMYRCLSGLASI